MKNNKFIPASILGLSVIIASIIFTSGVHFGNNKTAFNTLDANEIGPQYYSIKVPSYIDFAAEPVPLHITDVKERLERELIVNAYRHSTTFLYLKRKTRWFPMIERILAEEGVPDDFKYLCVAESGLDQVVSYAGATGFWQFMTGTGKEYGLEINSEVDERYHVEKSTRAACQYLRDAKNRLGTWTAAAASYNMGVSGFSRQQSRQQERNYYDILLNDETSRYMFRILALKEILSNPAQYGFMIDYADQYQPYTYREVLVDYSVDNFADFAKRNNTNYKTLKILNPWLRDAHLTVKNNTYMVKIPQ